jgi:glycosyltransferase involved in cell wall biosynthesis
LVLPKDEKQLAEAMIKTIQLSDNQRLEIGKNNRKKMVQGYSFQSINETYFELIKTLCPNK